MLVSDKKRLVFIHNPKTGGTSIYHWMLQNGAAYAPKVSGRPACNHLTAAECGLSDARWGSHYKFGFVRNPWSRLVSWWRMIAEAPPPEPWKTSWVYVYERAKTFEDFVFRCTDAIEVPQLGYTERFTRPQIEYFVDSQGHRLVDFIGRFESFQEDWAHVLQESDARTRKPWLKPTPCSPMRRYNEAPFGEKPYQAFYTPETRDIVAERFARDIEAFGYTFEA